MKLRIPKHIVIGEVKFRIRTDKSHTGGSLSYRKNEMLIGTKDMKRNPTRTLSVILHELKEAINIEQNIRYTRPDETAYEFHYTHREHDTMCAQLAGLLPNFIK